MDHFRTVGEQLLVNGRPIDLIKHQAGQTPFYVYDRSVIAKKINILREQLPTQLKLHYAIKANPMPAVVQFIGSLVDGLDVASGKELHTALNTGMNAHNISFAGPGKRPEELKMAVASGITVNVESANELRLLAQISDELNIRAKVALRVNPDFELKSSGMKMGGGAQQFGIDAELIPETFKQIKDLDLDYCGLHIFTGSQNLNADSIMAAHQGIFELADRLQSDAPAPMKSLNIGGGLGIPYFAGEKPIQLAAISAQLETLMDTFSNHHGCAKIAMELGRYIVGESGLYVSEVIDVKESRGTRFVVINGGLHHHLAASGNFGQVIRKNYPVALANKMQQPAEDPVQVVGPLCTPLDILANKYPLPKAEIGDLFVVYQSGAYGYSASPMDFLSHPHPVELLV